MSKEAPSSPRRSRRARWLYFAIGWVFFGLGAAGSLLPLLPTTPFMLLALWAFSNSSQRFHSWLYNHRVFGPSLQNWHQHRVVPWPVKITAYVSMLASLSYTVFIADVHWAIPGVTAAVMLVGVYVIARCPSRKPVDDGAPR